MSSPARASMSAPSRTRRAARPRPYVFTSPRALTTVTGRDGRGRGAGAGAVGVEEAPRPPMPPARTSPKSGSKRAARKPAAKTRARRASLHWRPRLPVIEQRHLDLAGLALVAAGVFLAFPLWLGWDGGEAGQALVDGLTWAVGVVAYATPVVLLAAGALLVLRPVLPAVRPFRAGALCLLGSALLLFGAGGEPVRHSGGVAGQALHDAAARAFSDVGASIIAIFLAAAGALLLTGASVAGVLRATHSQVSETTRGLRERRRPEDGDEQWEPPAQSPFFGPPEPPGEEPVVRPRTTGGSLDGALRYPDLFGTPAEIAVTGPPPPAEPEPEPEPEEPEPVGPEPEAAELEPAKPAAATAAPPKDGRAQLDLELPVADHDFALPEPRILKRSSPEQARPDTAGQEQTAARLVEALGHLGVQAQVIGAVAGPHITRYELQLAPGVKMAKVANLK